MLYNEDLVNSLISIKAKVKAELARRNGYGSLAPFADPTWDFAETPKTNDVVKNEHLKKIVDPLLQVTDFGDPEYIADVGSNPLANIEEAGVLLDKLIGQTMIGNESSCRSACSGLCLGTCTTACSGCTGCTGCTSCTGGCGSGCATECGGACVSGCGAGCQGGCNGCTSCAGECTSCTGCTGSCYAQCNDGCKTACTGSCGGTCSTSCGNSAGV